VKRESVVKRDSKGAVFPMLRLPEHGAIHDNPHDILTPAPEEVSTRVPQEFSAVPVSATATQETGPGLSRACPLLPRRCPFGGACHTCPIGVQAGS
jgi:hypothetical protein